MKIRAEVAGMLVAGVAGSFALCGSTIHADPGPCDALRQQLPMPQWTHGATNTQVATVEANLQALLRDWSHSEWADNNLDIDLVSIMSDYDDGIVWDLIDPDSIDISPPTASYTVQTRLGRVGPGEFLPVEVDEADLELFDADWYQPLQERLKYLSTLAPNWDSYGAEAPNAFALEMAEQALRLMVREGMEPRGIVPSAENGIGIVFRKDDKYADIEIFNHGVIYYLLDDDIDEPHAHQVSADAPGICDALRVIRAFLS